MTKNGRTNGNNGRIWKDKLLKMHWSMAEREDKWQKWVNLGEQIAKNALVNVLPNGRTKCQKNGWSFPGDLWMGGKSKNEDDYF